MGKKTSKKTLKKTPKKKTLRYIIKDGKKGWYMYDTVKKKRLSQKAIERKMNRKNANIRLSRSLGIKDNY